MTSGPELLEAFEKNWMTSLPDFEAAIAERWPKEDVREIVKPKLLVEIRSALQHELTMAQQNQTAADILLNKGYFKRRGRQLVHEQLNREVFDELWQVVCLDLPSQIRASWANDVDDAIIGQIIDKCSTFMNGEFFAAERSRTTTEFLQLDYIQNCVKQMLEARLDRMVFDALWAESKFDAQIDKRWRNEADRVIVKVPMLDKLESLLSDQFNAVLTDTDQGKTDKKPRKELNLATFKNWGMALLDTALNRTAFEALYLATEKHFRQRRNKMLLGRNVKVEGLDDIWQQFSKSLLPKQNGLWKFDPTEGNTFSAYAEKALRTAVAGHLRRDARGNGYRLEPQHIPLLRGVGVPEEWLQQLEPLIGEFHPTGRFFETAVKAALPFEGFSFNDHRIKAIFALAKIPSKSRDDVRNKQAYQESLTPDRSLSIDTRFDTSSCLRKMWKSNYQDEVVVIALVFLRGWPKKEVAEHLNCTPGNMTKLIASSLKLLRLCLEGANSDD